MSETFFRNAAPRGYRRDCSPPFSRAARNPLLRGKREAQLSTPTCTNCIVAVDQLISFVQ